MDGPAGLGEKHARQNFNEHGGEFQPPLPPMACWGGGVGGQIFYPFPPLFFSSIPMGVCGPASPGQGGAGHPPARAAPAPALIAPTIRQFVACTGRWRIFYGRSCTHY